MTTDASEAFVRAHIDENNRTLQTYCLFIVAFFCLGFMLVALQNVLLPILFAMFLVSDPVLTLTLAEPSLHTAH